MRTLVKRTQPNFLAFPSIFDEFLGNESFNHLAKTYKPSVNIKEDENGFSINMLIPGFKKEDVQINIENNVLSISAEVKEENTQENEKFSRKEFSFKSFKRSFSLPENIDIENIKANIENGVLGLHLPKVVKEESNKVKTIAID